MPEYLTFEQYDHSPTPEQIKAIYDSGFKGCLFNPFKFAQLGAGEDFYDAFPMARDIGKGKLIAPYKAALTIEPEFGRMEPQTTGDCVSHGVRNAGSIDFYCDIVFGETKIPAGAAKPRLATENIYGYRGHGGQGADPSRLTYYVGTTGPGGFLIRMKYSEGSNSVDLSKYNANIGHNWGRSGTPSWLNAIAAKNKALRIFQCKSLPMARDALALGFGINRGSWMSFSSERNEDGFASRTRQGWSHDESWVGFDDTEWCVKKYGQGAPCEQNSWGLWNGGPKRHEQPDGSYWMYPKDAQQMINDGEVFIVCSVRGYDRELVYDRVGTIADLSAA